MKKLLLAVVILLGAGGLYLFVDREGHPEKPGEITRQRVPSPWTEKLAASQHEARKHLDGATPEKQILFGDLHVHTTYSVDAFAWSMPIFHGDGVHPPAEACDYARFCSNLDFWATTEHAESLTPRHWRELKDTVRQCNAVSGDPQNPDLVTFLG